MLRDITFGQYYESHSVIHKTDPRIKIILLILLIVFIFLAKKRLCTWVCGAFGNNDNAYYQNTHKALF